MSEQKSKTRAARRPARPPAGAVRAKPATTDQYLAQLGEEQRSALEAVRRTVRGAAPFAEECLSYGLPAFRVDGRPLVAFGASAHHCAFYPMNPATVEAHRRELKDFDTSKGTVRFQPDRPLPPGLVRKLVAARVADVRRASSEAAQPAGGVR